MRKILLGFGIFLLAVVAAGLFGFILLSIYANGADAIVSGDMSSMWDFSLFFQLPTYYLGLGAEIAGGLLYFVFKKDNKNKAAHKMLSNKKGAVETDLENSRFMTASEQNFNFPKIKLSELPASSTDGIPVYAVAKNKDVVFNLAPPMHGLIIGSTGSGKTTTFINPTIQELAHSGAKSSLVVTDPKGELFQSHSKLLAERGWDVLVLDLRDPYESSKWNPLSDLYDRYQHYLHCADGLYIRTDPPAESGLELLDPPGDYGEEWYEFSGSAYASRRRLVNILRTEKQKIYDELYEDLNDLISILVPIDNQDDPVWEKGARSIIMAVALAMLEDSAFPELEMTREKFCFYNINKAIGNNADDYKELRDYFAGRNVLSKSVALSKQVLSAANETLASYMSIAFDKMSLFNDEGLCALTGSTEIDPASVASKPTALFLKIPDEKDTRHALAGVFVLSLYKSLIKVASARESLSLPRNVYFLLDEFGNMPRIDKFDKMITVGRSRKIWFEMVVQSLAQLKNVYGDTIADIIKSNCGLKMFIGSNDIDTCKEFSELCGNISVSTKSVSTSTAKDADGYNVSESIQSRPLIYPSELQKLNNKATTGNAIIVTFGNYPLKTKYTPSYKCPLYKMGQMKLPGANENTFFGEDVYYDLGERNYIILENNTAANAAEATK